MISYFIYFIIFGLIGWAIDTGYRFLHGGKENTFIPHFALIYAIGGISLFIFYTQTTLHPFAHILIGGFSITILEFAGGIFCIKFLGRRLWDYSTQPYNLFGHVDLQHLIYWFFLAALLRIITPVLPI